jgi:hypothetical protein
MQKFFIKFHSGEMFFFSRNLILISSYWYKGKQFAAIKQKGEKMKKEKILEGLEKIIKEVQGYIISLQAKSKEAPIDTPIFVEISLQIAAASIAEGVLIGFRGQIKDGVLKLEKFSPELLKVFEEGSYNAFAAMMKSGE